MPGGNYEAGNLHPAPPPTPSPHLICGFAPYSYTLRHPTSALPLSLCPSTAPRVRVRVRAVARPSARQLINKPTALPHRIRVPFFTVRVRYWPRPASSAPALFISPLLSLTSNIFGQGGGLLFWDYSILKKPYSLASILKKPYSLAYLAQHAVRVTL